MIPQVERGLRSYSADPLTWDGRAIRWGKWEIPMREGGLDEAPGEVKEVRLLIPEWGKTAG